MKFRHWEWLGLLIFAGVVVGAIYWHKVRVDNRGSTTTLRHLNVLEADCDAAKAKCIATLADDVIRLQLGPPVPAMKSFPIHVDTTLPVAGTIKSVTVNFEMVGMDMGHNEYRLMPAGAGQWGGTAILPVCTTGRVDWRAIVTVEGAELSYQASFPFRVTK